MSIAQSPDSKIKWQKSIGLGLLGLLWAAWIMLHIYAVFFFEFSISNALFIPLIMAALCWLSVGLFIAAHDAMHGSLLPGYPRLNDAIGSVILALYAGFGWRKMRGAHWDHHKYSGSDKDPDFNADNPRSFWPWYAKFFSEYFGIWSVLYVLFVVAIYMLIFDAAYANIIIFYGVPAIASSVQLFAFGTYMPHHHGPDAFADHHNARSNDYGYLASLLSCFHFGYHHEHHLRPHVPWWALPRYRS